MSMTFYAAQSIFQFQIGERVFTRRETSEYVHPANDEVCDVFSLPENPDYRPELDINVSNQNFGLVIRTLGYEYGEGDFMTPAFEFLAACRSWLAKNLNKPSTSIPATPMFGRENFIDCGVPENYLNRTIYRLAVFAAAAVERGGTVIYAA